jgi:diguanylate cyclase (GGDEF)-like protein
MKYPHGGNARTVAAPEPAAAAPERPLLFGPWLNHCLSMLAWQEQALDQARACQLTLEQALADARTELGCLHAELAGSRACADQARYAASHDSLTGLLNRSHFLQQLELSLTRPDGAAPGGPVVFFIDLDRFKQVNDQHGHAVGDEVLRIVAARLRRSVRAADLVCRLGGDEFACLLQADAGPAALIRRVSKLLSAVAAPMTLGPLQLRILACVGIARAPGDGQHSAELLAHADAAMYQAKRRGGGGFMLHGTSAGAERVLN